MQVELEHVTDEQETYRVRLVEDDNKGKRIVTGMVKRIGPADWHFWPTKDGEPGDVRLALSAKDADELRAVFATRFGSVEIRSDRLTNATMNEAAVTAFDGLYALAKETGSVTGFTAGLAHALARVIADSVPEDKMGEFTATFIERAAHHTASIRREKIFRSTVDQFMSGLLARAEDEGDQDDDDAQPTH